MRKFKLIQFVSCFLVQNYFHFCVSLPLSPVVKLDICNTKNGYPNSRPAAIDKPWHWQEARQRQGQKEFKPSKKTVKNIEFDSTKSTKNLFTVRLKKDLCAAVRSKPVKWSLLDPLHVACGVSIESLWRVDYSNDIRFDL